METGGGQPQRAQLHRFVVLPTSRTRLSVGPFRLKSFFGAGVGRAKLLQRNGIPGAGAGAGAGWCISGVRSLLLEHQVSLCLVYD